MIVGSGTIWLGKRSGETRCGRHTSIADEQSNAGTVTMNDPAARNLIQGHAGSTTPKSTVYMSYWYNGAAPTPAPTPAPSSGGCITFTYTGHYCYWTPPAGVTSVSVVAVGAGTLCSAGGGGGALSWQNNIPVNSCTRYAIWAAGQGNGDRSQFGVSSVPFNGHNLVLAGGGGSYCYCSCRGGVGGIAYHASQYTAGSSGGGNGGNGGSGIKNVCCRQYVSGGGGAGGYTGPGGDGGCNRGGGGSGFSGSGGGGGGGGSGFYGNATGGGGVGIRGLGPSGAGGLPCHSGSGGSGGSPGAIIGGNYGGGGAGGSTGGSGAVRIVWPGTTRQFPSTNVS